MAVDPHAGQVRLPALVGTAFLLSGCAVPWDDRPDFEVHADNRLGRAAQVWFRATHDASGDVVLEVNETVPPGTTTLGRVRGPQGDYTLEAWSVGGRVREGPGIGLHDGTVGCFVTVAPGAPPDIGCDVL